MNKTESNINYNNPNYPKYTINQDYANDTNYITITYKNNTYINLPDTNKNNMPDTNNLNNDNNNILDTNKLNNENLSNNSNNNLIPN